jgi:hypothetical protein
MYKNEKTSGDQVDNRYELFGNLYLKRHICKDCNRKTPIKTANKTLV